MNVIYCLAAVAVGMIAGGSCQEAAIYQECNSTINEGQALITSPSFPGFYPPNIFCTYEIHVQEGMRIRLGFRFFDIEKSPGCIYDYVKVFDGPTTSHPQIGKFCGPFRPSNVQSTSNQMLLVLKSDGSNTNVGFIAEYISDEEVYATPGSCGGVISSNSGSFHSLNYPKANYPNRKTCTWHIRASSDRRVVVLTFKKFAVEKSRSCMYDAVVVYGYDAETRRGKSLGRFCGKENPGTIVSPGNELFVTFMSDSSGNDIGFDATFDTFTDDPGIQEQAGIEPVCAETFVLSSSTGVINSPKVVIGRSGEMQCSWMIVTNPGTTITITVSKVVTGYSLGCTRSHLLIFAGRSANRSPLGKYCGDISDKEIEIGGNEAFVTFHASNDGEYFMVDYTAIVPMRNRASTTTTSTTESTTTTTTTETTTTTKMPPTILRASNTPRVNCPTVCPKKPRLVPVVCASETVIAVKLQNTRNIATSGTAGVVIKSIKGSFSVDDDVTVFMPCKKCKQKIKKTGTYLMIGTTFVDNKVVIDPTNFVVRYKAKKHNRALAKAMKKCR